MTETIAPNLAPAITPTLPTTASPQIFTEVDHVEDSVPPWVETPTKEEIVAAHTAAIIDKIESVTEVPVGLYAMGTWSYSKVGCLSKCPFQYFLKYVVKYKIPEGLSTQSDPYSAIRGTAAHEILEHSVVGKKLDDVYSKTRTKYIAEGKLTANKWDELVDPLRYNIQTFLERMEGFGRVNPIKRILTELRLGVTTDYKPAGFFAEDVWLRGVIDLVVMLENQDLLAIDHKTGGGQGSIRTYQTQLDWYKVLFHFGIEKVRGVQPAIHFIEAGDVRMAEYSPAKDIETSIKNSVEMHIEGAISSLTDKGYFKHVRGSYCKWCEFDGLGCKSGELKQAEIGTKRVIRIAPV